MYFKGFKNNQLQKLKKTILSQVFLEVMDLKKKIEIKVNICVHKALYSRTSNIRVFFYNSKNVL